VDPEGLVTNLQDLNIETKQSLVEVDISDTKEAIALALKATTRAKSTSMCETNVEYEHWRCIIGFLEHSSE
jgi:hypothetical protein